MLNMDFKKDFGCGNQENYVLEGLTLKHPHYNYSNQTSSIFHTLKYDFFCYYSHIIFKKLIYLIFS